MPDDTATLDMSDEIQQLIQTLSHVEKALRQVVLGQEQVITELMCALLAGGHVLIEGTPGLGKTLLAQAMSRTCSLSSARIQFTPDLMPADITGGYRLMPDDAGGTQLQHHPGPIFAHMILADELNRATPKTQSALLEAMQEGTVTADGISRPLPQPFMVLATQNPLEMEGTYPLPEAQLDRFLINTVMPQPSGETLDTLLRNSVSPDPESVPHLLSAEDIITLQGLTLEVTLAPHIREAIVNLALATRPDTHKKAQDTAHYSVQGISPRGAQALALSARAHALLHGHYHVRGKDVQAMLAPTWRHRVRLNSDAMLDGISPDDFLTMLNKTLAHAL